MKKIFTTLLISITFFSASFGQVKGAFTDVYLKKTLMPDIPDKVKTYIDSLTFFVTTLQTTMVRNYDQNNYISGGSSIISYDDLEGSDTIKVSFTSTLSGSILTILNKTVYSNDWYEMTREVIEYNNGLPVKVNIDTLNDFSQWKTKYRYEYSYEGSKVSSLKYYELNGSNFYLSSHGTFTYNPEGRPTNYKTLVYQPNVVIPDTMQSVYYYSGNKLDSLVGRNSEGMTINKFVVFYGSSGRIEKVDNYISFFGEPFQVGSSWFYGESLTSIKETETFKNVVVNNPVKDQLLIRNTPDMPIDLFDQNGRLVLSSRTTSHIDVSHLSSGLYFVTIKGQSGSISKKIIKE